MTFHFKDWHQRPAKWWQFWLPQSGAIGGTILILLAALFILAPILYFFTH